MARKGKLGQKALKETIVRPIRYKKYGYLFLVVCEDQATEPAYFNQFIEAFPEYTIYLKPIGTGLDPLGVVKRAKEETEKLKIAANREVDYIWVVFDRDDAHLNEACINRFNAAYEMAIAEKFDIAFSNEVFELWLLLHLTNIAGNASLPRQQIYTLLEEAIRQRSGYEAFIYKHGDPEIVRVIKEIGDESTAIERADVLMAFHNDVKPLFANPSTTVHNLVRDLRKWIDYYTYE